MLVLAESDLWGDAKDASVGSHQNRFDVPAVFRVIDLCELLPNGAVFDFFGADEARRVASARGSDGGIKRVSESVAESDAWRAGFDEFARARAIKHARLGSHDGTSLYTGGECKEVESRRLKVGKKKKDSQE